MDVNDTALSLQFEEDVDTYDFRQLYDTLIEHRDVILTIPEDQVEFLRKGLSVHKAKFNAKLKANGLVPSTDSVTYTVYKTKEDEDTPNTHVRMKLGPRNGITVLKMEIPDDSL